MSPRARDTLDGLHCRSGAALLRALVRPKESPTLGGKVCVIILLVKEAPDRVLAAVHDSISPFLGIGLVLRYGEGGQRDHPVARPVHRATYAIDAHAHVRCQEHPGDKRHDCRSPEELVMLHICRHNPALSPGSRLMRMAACALNGL